MGGTGSHALVVIDPQNDFCDQRGSLYVDGAASDIARLSSHITERGGEYSDIFVSLDSHDVIAIFHPRFWVGEDGLNPAPFTRISEGDLSSGKWRPASPLYRERAAKTFSAMKSKQIDSMMIWPEHCVVSTWGCQIADALRDALRSWRGITGRAVRYVFKGENPFTDQFSIFEGVDSSWPETSFNEALFSRLSGFDAVTFAGEALSHCVESSIVSYTGRLGHTARKSQKITLLADCTSPVAGFDRQSSLSRITASGVSCVTTAS
ncbi:MAG: isochorismatase family protein [Synergistaceae bacterium]|jgi:nicotinamidase-related amidase|nr:isochorismatase family protein [Synergistaceae bacterium]